MALGRALVDQARQVVREASQERLRGQTQFEWTHRQWFRCRLNLQGVVESRDGDSPRPRTVFQPTLLYGVRDKDGEPVDLGNETRLEVASPQLGTELWDVVGDPTPLRKRRRVIGFEVTLRRVSDAELPDAVVL